MEASTRSDVLTPDLSLELPAYTRSLALPVMVGSFVIYSLLLAEKLINPRPDVPDLALVLGAVMAALAAAGCGVLIMAQVRYAERIVGVWFALAIAYTVTIGHLIPQHWDIARLALLLLTASLVVLSTPLMMLIATVALVGGLSQLSFEQDYGFEAQKVMLWILVASACTMHFIRRYYLTSMLNKRQLAQQKAEQSARLLRYTHEGDVIIGKLAEKMLANLCTEDVLRAICQAAVKELGASRAAAILWRNENHLVHVAINEGGLPGVEPLLQALPLPSGWLKECLSNRDANSFVVIDSDRFASMMSPFAWPHGGTTFAVALRRGSDVVGALVLNGPNIGPLLLNGRRNVCEGLAYLASLALNDAYLLEALKEANEIKSRFLMTASHELRTPLAVIIGHTELMKATLDLSEVQKQHLKKIEGSSRQLLVMIDQILESSRMAFLRVPTEEVRFDVKVMLNELLAKELPLIDDTEVKTQLIAVDGLSIKTDEQKLKGALGTILHNAVKFTSKGDICVEALGRDGGVEFTVEDSGIGFDANQVEHIFEPFRQLDDKLTRSFPGLGLGLHLSASLIRLLGGTITVKSRPNEGSIFRVWIPDRSLPALT